MVTFFFRVKYSATAIKGMVENPQDRETPIRAIATAVGINIDSVYFSADSAEVMGFASGTHESKDAFYLMAYASGALDRNDSECVEVIDSSAFKASMQKASDIIGKYKVAGSSN